MKVIKPPAKMNPDIILEEKMKHPICPFCGADKERTIVCNDIEGDTIYQYRLGVKLVSTKYYYGFSNISKYKFISLLIEPIAFLLNVFGVSNFFIYYKFHCQNCGAEWESDPYPTDLCKKINWNNLLK